METARSEWSSDEDHDRNYSDLERLEARIDRAARIDFQVKLVACESLMEIKRRRLWIYRTGEDTSWREYLAEWWGFSYSWTNNLLRFYERFYLRHKDLFHDERGQLRPLKNLKWILEDLTSGERPDHREIPRLFEASQTLNRQGFEAELKEVFEGKAPEVAEEEAQKAQMHRAKKVRERQLQERDVGNPRVWRSERFRSWVREQSCVICGSSPCDPHHIATRGSGAGDLLNLVSLCRVHHRQAQDGHLKRDFRDEAVGLLIDYICWLESEVPQEVPG